MLKRLAARRPPPDQNSRARQCHVYQFDGLHPCIAITTKLHITTPTSMVYAPQYHQHLTQRSTRRAAAHGAWLQPSRGHTSGAANSLGRAVQKSCVQSVHAAQKRLLMMMARMLYEPISHCPGCIYLYTVHEHAEQACGNAAARALPPPHACPPFCLLKPCRPTVLAALLVQHLASHGCSRLAVGLCNLCLQLWQGSEQICHQAIVCQLCEEGRRQGGLG